MIMLVEDDIGMRDVCAMFLQSKGYDVRVAASGSEAISKMREFPHDLVISDCAMPGMSGVQLSENLKADPCTAQVPILLMSASMRSDIADSTCYEAFLRKPFLAGTLLDEVRRLLLPGAALALPTGLAVP